MMLSVLTSLLIVALLLSEHVHALNKEELEALVKDLRGDDERLMRWDATEHTAEKQHSGSCESLPAAFDLIGSTEVDDQLKGLACEYATWCITNNMDQRVRLAAHGKDIYAAIVQLVQSDNAYASAKASHLIYIASFAHGENQNNFYRAGAVPKLSNIIQRAADPTPKESSSKATEPPKPFQIMWAASALQNLAASYCDVEGGWCEWFWPKNKDYVEIIHQETPLMSDATNIRKEMLQIGHLIPALVKMVCSAKPIHGEMSDDNPWPGENAVAGKHDDSPNVVPWAIAGALKNIALEPEAKPQIEPALSCLCRLAHYSPDWLEQSKAEQAIYHLRRGDPCWFDLDEVDDEHTGSMVALCVDRYFVDQGQYSCADYEDATEEECDMMDINDTVKASEACCACGGGDQYNQKHRMVDEL